MSLGEHQAAVSRTTWSRGVIPFSTFSQPSMRSVSIPSSIATFWISAAPALCMISFLSFGRHVHHFVKPLTSLEPRSVTLLAALAAEEREVFHPGVERDLVHERLGGVGRASSWHRSAPCR